MFIKNKESLWSYVPPDGGIDTNQIYKHCALIVRGNKVLAVACNQVGSRSRGCGFSKYTIHAERNVVRKLGDSSKLKGATMYIFRVSHKNVRIGRSEPCYECQVFLKKCIDVYGLSRVYYTVDENAAPSAKHDPCTLHCC